MSRTCETSVVRALRDFQGVPQKNKLQLEALRRLADHSRNYHEYRSRLRNTAPPAVPFLGEVYYFKDKYCVLTPAYEQDFI